MKTNKFLGLVGTAAAAFAVFSIACAAPPVQRSHGGDDPTDTSGTKTDTGSTSTPTTTTTPSTSTATTTATTAKTTDAGTTSPPGVDSCALLAACANKTDGYEAAGWLVTATIIRNQDVCAGALIACKTGIVGDLFGNACDDLTVCCDEMSTNTNSGLANACRAKANAGNSDACQTQLDTYETQGRCN